MTSAPKRDRSVSSRLLAEEDRAFRARCQADGVPRSRAVRALIAEYAAGRNVAPQIYTQLVVLQEELRRLGVNLNQLLHLAHTEALQGGAAELRGFAWVTAVLARSIDELVVILEPYRGKRRRR